MFGCGKKIKRAGKSVVIQTLNTYIIWSNVEFELESPTLAVMIPADMRPTSIWPL